jgi:hypothetical protein
MPGSSFAFKMSFTGRVDTDVARQMVVLILKSDVNDSRVKLRFTDLSRNVSGVMLLPASVRESDALAVSVMGAYGGGYYEPCAPILNAQRIYDTFIASNKS